ncbi:MAG TPA: PASTA domain-containing protein [Pyrinomonadaceae bacterium]|nr:PASTA domain-containing protein [Chloracidobacterium sp.]MBP9936284.1 PASTA domain-containing protein [Pyrinomonadaceae bacterium]MBK7803701.1 PASTA domain-containing protein [Chloracidobacterium sp.]MBL0239102.1 PASTA domain-containing protein [Chloracidobacterium sp.]HQX54741.1 PASTA domain-containing protein [Pyrinomonadaceae bacterium]
MRGISAIGKLIALAILVCVFFGGMAGVIYFSLQGVEIKVPELTGKNFTESEHELASLGLKIKKRADRVTADPPNTVIEQLPRPGETVKTGQWILVVTSKPPIDGDEVPQSLKKTDEDDTEKIEEMITEKPKKPKANSNTNRKKAETTRDVASNVAGTNSNSDSVEGNSNKKEGGTTTTPGDKNNKNASTPNGRPGSGSNTSKPSDSRPKNPNRPNR